MRAKHIIRSVQLLVVCMLVFSFILTTAQPAVNLVAAQTPDQAIINLPLIMNNWPPIPETPVIDPISNYDMDNHYGVYWSLTRFSDFYVLEEAADANFTNPTVVYQGSYPYWEDTNAKYPGAYYYRVKGVNALKQGAWSTPVSVTIHPMFVGLMVRWDGVGFIRLDYAEDVGTHETTFFDKMINNDTIHAENAYWYDPNPEGWYPSYWESYYSSTTGALQATTWIDDPMWKWSSPWMLPYSAQYTNGSTVTLDGQPFIVTGPFNGYTTFGTAIKYWKFVNKQKFIYVDSSCCWKQYVHAGDIVLYFDAGASKLNIYSSVLRRYYYNGSLSAYTVQYISQLVSASSIPGSPPFTPSLLPALNQTAPGIKSSPESSLPMR